MVATAYAHGSLVSFVWALVPIMAASVVFLSHPSDTRSRNLLIVEVPLHHIHGVRRLLLTLTPSISCSASSSIHTSEFSASISTLPVFLSALN